MPRFATRERARTGSGYRLMSTGCAVAALLALAVSCSRDSAPDHLAERGEGTVPRPAGQRRETLVETSRTPRRALDPRAKPTTSLGQLRSQHFEVWTSEFDWAFPPQECDSAWELDSIAEPAHDVDVSRYGDVPTMTALAVMRYEYLVGKALVNPQPLAQLCVAVGSVGEARADALGSLASRIAGVDDHWTSFGYPSEVELLAVSPTAVLAVACSANAAATLSDIDAADSSSVDDPLRLRAYLLRTAMGREDAVPDVSLRVSSTSDQPAQSCAEMTAWAERWNQRVDRWIADGRLWTSFHLVLTVHDVCNTSVPANRVDCPSDWPQ